MPVVPSPAPRATETRNTGRNKTIRCGLACGLIFGGLGLAWGSLPLKAQSAGDERHHALSLVGEPKFGADFKAFDWVNPDAPKAGTVRLWVQGTFDTLNGFGIRGNAASGLGLVYDTMMAGSPDEPSTEYCLVCEWVSYPPDFSSATFELREQARFNDGRPITPEDAIFSLEALKKANPRQAAYYKNVVKAEKTGERQVTFRFDETGNRELPQILGQLVILPKHFYEAKSAGGDARDLDRATLEPPLGSGPYRLKSLEPGRTLIYERVKDWWAKDLPVSKGQWNFDEIRLTYYRDKTPAFEAFKSGQVDFWRENSAKDWVTRFEFDAVKQGQVKQEKIPIARVAPMQAFVMNLRRKQFQDARVRRAFNFAFNFELANKNLFYDQYVRVDSYFGNSELAATGLPEGRELELLKEVEKEIPPEVFTTAWTNPVYKTPEDERKNLGAAARLLAEAGYTVRNGVLANAAGEQLTAEFLGASPDSERLVLPYIADLKKLGIKANLRIVDSSQFQSRERNFDFDIITDQFPQSNSPGNEQRDFFGSAAADAKGSRNTIGMKNPGIDKLIEKVVFAKDRAELIAATRALDRVLLWNHVVVPQYHLPFDRVATWNMFGRPAKLPSQATSFQQVWWFDETAAAKLGPGRGR